MLLTVRFQKGHSLDVIIIDNVVEYSKVSEDSYVVTYKDPQHNYDLYDIGLKHVAEIKEG